MNKVTKIGFATLAITATIVASTLLAKSFNKEIVASEAATSRTITFTKSHSSVTTSDGNTFLTELEYGSRDAGLCTEFYYAFLTCLGVSVPDGATYGRSSAMNISGDFPFNKITKISFRWKCSPKVVFKCSFLNDETQTVKETFIIHDENSRDDQGTSTLTPAQIAPHKGLHFTASTSATYSSISSAAIYELTITYAC